MTATRPRTRSSRLSREDRVAEIVVQARAVIAERGYENALVAEVAARSNVVEGTIYRYFDTKRDLFIHVAEHWFEEILSEHKTTQAITGTLNRLRYLIWRALSIIRQEPALTRFVLMEMRPDPTYRSLRLYKLNRKFTSGVTDVVREAIETGEFRPGVPQKLIRDMIFGGIEHQTWAYLRNEGDFSVDEAAEHIAEVVYRGMVQSNVVSEAEGVAARLERVADRLEKLDVLKK